MKIFLKITFLSFILIVLFNFNCSRNELLKDGDIIFQISESSQSKAIQIATKSEYSHMGIIYKIDNQYYVYEAIQPVKLTKIDDWIKRGNKKKYVVKRLKNYQSILTQDNINRMREVGKKFIGKDYDLFFEWSDEKIYCSELVWKIYYRSLGVKIGKLKILSDFDLTHPLVKVKLENRFGKNVPLNEKVISPGTMFESDQLFTVYER